MEHNNFGHVTSRENEKPHAGCNRHSPFVILEVSMYIPKSFAESDVTTLYKFIRNNNFAALIIQYQERLVATHLPFLIDTERGVLKAHLARANDQWQAFDGREALVMFHGPHAYISPTWYETHPSVPTWNYTVVHVYGVPHIID